MSRGRLAFIVVVSVVTVSLIVLLVLHVLADGKSQKEQTAQELAVIAELKGAEISWWLRERLSDGRAHIAAQPGHGLDALLDRGTGPVSRSRRTSAKNRFIEWMSSASSEFDYVSVSLVDRQGEVLLSVPEDGGDLLRAYIGDPPVPPDDGEARLLPMRLLPNGGRRLLGMSVPIPYESNGGGDRQRDVTLICLIDPSRFLDQLTQSWPNPSDSAETLLVARDGGEIVFLNELRHRKGAALTLRLPVAMDSRPAVQAALGREGFVEGEDYRGVAVFAAVRAIPEARWFLVAKVDRDEVMASNRVHLIETLLLGLLVVAVAVLLFRIDHHRTQLQKAALRSEVEGRYRAMVESSRDGVIFLEPGGKIEIANLAFLEMFGCARESEVIGRAGHEFFAEDERSRLGEIFETGSSGSANALHEVRGLRRSGSEFRSELSVSRIDWRGRPYLQATFRDVTARHETQERLAFEARLNQSLYEVATLVSGDCDPDEVALHIHAALKKVTDAELGLIAYWDDAHEQLLMPTFPDSGWGPGPCAWVLEHGDVLLVNDPEADPRCGARADTGAPLRSFLGVPVLSGEEVLGVVALANAPERFGERDRTAAEHFALLFSENLKRRVAVNRTEALEQEKDSLERQLTLSQRLEAVGRLAGGIAHDFNNMLTVIGGHGSLVSNALGDEHPLAAKMKAIRTATDRAGGLTRQLLAFSRRQVLVPQVFILNSVIEEMESMLRPIIGEDVHLLLDLEGDLSAIRADPGQIGQVVMNLVVNARDAMPDGGALTVKTRNVRLDQGFADRHLGVSPGRHVMLSVADTGVGVLPEIQEKIFEPFFTTKETKGTGLGLSVTYGIVKQSGGTIWVESEPGRGAEFSIYLPVATERPTPLPEAASEGESRRGSETVLLVEDEAGVRDFVAEVLQSAGYRVLSAEDGIDALDVSSRHRDEIDLLLTDLVMPGLGGPGLWDALSAGCDGVKVLFMSGYGERDMIPNEDFSPGGAFLQKPFTIDQLLEKVGQVLDSSSA